jgi:hypothetical protein
MAQKRVESRRHYDTEGAQRKVSPRAKEKRRKKGRLQAVSRNGINE